MGREVELAGIRYRVTERAGLAPLVYKRYPTGPYFRWSVIWGDTRRSKVPQVGSQVARVLALAGRA